MGHLLMVESWVESMSRLLPRAIREAGHSFTFVTRNLPHYLRGGWTGEVPPLLTAENVLTAETNDASQLAARAARWQEVFRFDGVISSCDYYLGTVAQLAAELGLPGPDPAAASRRDRGRVRN